MSKKKGGGKGAGKGNRKGADFGSRYGKPSTDMGADFAVPCVCGELRGKRYRRSEVAKTLREGFNFPVSVYAMDTPGEVLNVRGIGVDDGDPDFQVRPITETWMVQPWNDPPMGLVLCEVLDADGCPHVMGPRAVLQNILSAFTRATGLRVMAAFELEYYLLSGKRGRDGGAVLYSPRPANERETATETYGLAPLLPNNANVLIDEWLERTGLPLAALTHEASAGQYEINLDAVPDAIRAADESSLLRHGIACAASVLGGYASFCPKPFADRPGSGLQLNISLLDSRGRNVFVPNGDSDGDGDSNSKMSRIMRQSLAGMLHYMPDAMLIYSPHQNAYRRHVPGQFAPTDAFWDADNRNAALRVPVARSAKETRIEHRLAAADASPYLVTAAILVSIALGLESEMELPRARSGRALPHTFPRAWLTAKRSRDFRRRFNEWSGGDYFDFYAELKEAEYNRFMSEPQKREWEWYL